MVLSAPPDATLDCPEYAIVALVQGGLGEPGVTLGAKGAKAAVLRPIAERRILVDSRRQHPPGRTAVTGARRPKADQPLSTKYAFKSKRL